MTENYNKMLDLIKDYHKDQTRNNGKVPYWHHCASVAEILASAVKQSREINDNALLDDLLVAALAHDLIEDTTMTPEELKQKTNSRTLDLVMNMTNTEDDEHRTGYMAKIQNATEEVLLIKICDLIENTISCAYGIPDLTKKWVKEFYMPIFEDTKKVIDQKKIEHYPQTANILMSYLAFSEERLYHNISKYEEEHK